MTEASTPVGGTAAGRTFSVPQMLSLIVGTLFLAILIAKLVGVYPPPAREPVTKE